MPATDVATPPSRGGLSRLRRNQGDGANDSTNSLISSSNSDDPNGDSGVGLRPTSSGGIGKLTDRLRRRSVDDRRGSDDSGKRLSALIPSRRNKLKRAKSSELKRNAEPGSTGLPQSNNGSDSSLAQAGSGRSSLFTEDNSDIEGCVHTFHLILLPARYPAGCGILLALSPRPTCSCVSFRARHGPQLPNRSATRGRQSETLRQPMAAASLLALERGHLISSLSVLIPRPAYLRIFLCQRSLV